VNLEFQAIVSWRAHRQLEAAAPRAGEDSLCKDTTTKYFVTIQTAEDAILLVSIGQWVTHKISLCRKQARRGGREGQSKFLPICQKNTTKKRGAIILTNSSGSPGSRNE